MWSLLKPRSVSSPTVEPAGLHEFLGETMGTTFTVKVVVPAARWAQVAERVEPAIQAELDLVNARMSTWRADSELSQFNQSAETAPTTMSPETLEVFRIAQEVSAASGGAFDVTVGPLVNAWGFGPDGQTLEGPSDAELVALRARVGYQALDIDRAASTLRKARPDVYCDLSAVAKGYGVDRVAQALEGLGIDNYMVEIGGEIRTRGAKDGRGWHLAIEKPVMTHRETQKVLAIPPGGLALATSGDYRNYLEVDGVRLSHTIDPRTGRPIAHALASVSVIHAECAYADAYATALMVLGPEDGYHLALDLDLAALFIIRDAPGQFTEKATSAFERLE